MSDLSEWKPVLPTREELTRIGAVVVHGARLEQLLAFILAEMKSDGDESADPLRDAYATVGGRPSLIVDIRSRLAKAPDDRLSQMLDRSEKVLEERHGFAHGVPHVHLSGERASIRTVTASKALKHGFESREVGVSLDPESVALLCTDMLDVFNDLAEYLGSRLPDDLRASADHSVDMSPDLS